MRRWEYAFSRIGTPRPARGGCRCDCASLTCQGPPEATAPPPDGGDPVVAGPFLAAGAEHTCAIFAAGAVRCWGDNRLGQLGLAAGNDPLAGYSVDLGRGRRASAVYAGLYHTCVILDGGAVKCWGDNSLRPARASATSSRAAMARARWATGCPSSISGRVGAPWRSRWVARRRAPLLDDGASSAGATRTRGRRATVTSRRAATGPGRWVTTCRPSISAAATACRSEVKAIAAFDYHSFCAILDDTGPDNSGLKCWGSNDYCELGIGSHDSGRGSMPGTLGDELEWVDIGTTAAGGSERRSRLAAAINPSARSATTAWSNAGDQRVGRARHRRDGRSPLVLARRDG